MADIDRGALLRRVDLLAGLDRVALARLAAFLEPVHVRNGERVCAQDEPGDSMFLVVQGSFAVFARRDGADVRVAQLGPGDSFGEMALLTDEPRAATVRAEGDGEVMRLERERFLRLVDGDPKVGRAISVTLAHRLQGMLRADGGVAQRAHRTPPEPVVPPARSVTRTRAVRVGALLIAGALAAVAILATTAPAERFALFVAAALLLWMTDAVPVFITALALLASWVMSGVADPAAALAGFGSSSWVFVVSVLGLAATISRSGLLLRVGIVLVKRLPADLRWQIAALLGTGILLTPLLPLQMARAALLSPLALSVAEALRLRERGPGSAAIGLAAWIGAGPMVFLFLNGSTGVLLMWALLPAESRARFDWITWLVSAAPLGALCIAGALVLLVLGTRGERATAPTAGRLDLQLAILGRPSSAELALVGIVVLTVAGWMFGEPLGLDPGIVALLGFIAAALATRFDGKALASLDWGYLVFYGAILGLVGVSHTLGIDTVMGELIGGSLARLGITGPAFVLAVAVTTGVARTFLQADQIGLLLPLALIPAAPAAGVDPWLVIIAVLAMISFWAVPAVSPEYLVVHSSSEGRLFTHAQARRLALAYAAIVLAALLLVTPYWRTLGLL